jgi:hypothetical protein
MKTGEVTMGKSRFAQFAVEGSRRMFLGTLLKFVKGDWLMGPDKDLVPPDMRFVAVMDTATIGFFKWADGKPVDHKTGLIADGFRMPQRRDLDDFDSKSWRVDENGDRVDPWQQTTLLVLVSPDEPHDLFTFSTSTVGGEGAVTDLCGAHGRTTEGVGQYPVVTLTGDSYDHRIKSRGSVKVPVFKIVDSVAADEYNRIVAEARGGADFVPTSPPALGTADPIAIASERQPPTPPKPPAIEGVSIEDAPPEDAPEGPSEFDDDIPY